MKKTKSFLCVTLLSILLVGNVFAGDTSGGGIFSFFSNMVSAVWSAVGDDNCTPRQCTNCRPDQKDEDGNCRPRN